MKRCSKKIFVKPLNKYKQCIRSCNSEGNHSGTHTPDLRGEKFGKLVVIKLGKPNKEKMREYVIKLTTWIVKQDGIFRTVTGHSLISGNNSGIGSFNHGFSRKRNGKISPEFSTVTGHYAHIFKNTNPRSKSYKNMPFYDGWNPDKGGAFWKGAKWIIENLGRKPGKEWSLDIINHEKGFVPGNLRWGSRIIQRRNQKYKFLGLFSIKELRVEAKRHGYKLVQI